MSPDRAMPTKTRSTPRAVALLLACVAALNGIGSTARAEPASPGAHAVRSIAPEAAATVVDARDALRRKDRVRLAALRSAAVADHNPLAMWVDYWELGNRLADAQQDELTAFAARWPGSYVEDRLRNDWLLELGRRRDWADFAVEFPLFRMNDDREVTCYALLVDQLAGKDVREAAVEAWIAQRGDDDGCALLAATLYDKKLLSHADVWRKARAAVDANKPRAARQAVELLGPGAAAAIGPLFDSPIRYLTHGASASTRTNAELTTLALMRLAATDADGAAAQLADRWERALPPGLAAWAWAVVARQSAIGLKPEAADRYLRAERTSGKGSRDLPLTGEMLAWKVRSALRADDGKPRWQQVVQAVNAMSESEQKDSAWVYWKARGLQALAKDSEDGTALRGSVRDLLASIASPLTFYGTLAADELGQPGAFPARPAAPTAEERDATLARPGFARALQMMSIGLRGEGVREWNYTLRGMNDRELLAAAQLACEREVWDRCINTSERTRTEIDVDQRYPMPYRRDLVATARDVGLDPAYVYGVVRQESRFMVDARSAVGASGLMQLMPATARWTAKKIGLAYTPAMIGDRDTNLRLGSAYLKLILDDFGGSQALGAAAYNAGPGRPRRWRDGPVLEPAMWIENIPFSETRDYVKKVLGNATAYAALMGGNVRTSTLRSRLGSEIGPGDRNAPADRDLP